MQTGAPSALDQAGLAASTRRVADLVAAVAAGDTAALRAVLGDQQDGSMSGAAAAAATAALAGRLLPLSGVTGPAAVDGDEEPGDLLRAYAELLVSRTDPYRVRLAPGVGREALQHVARAAAAAARPQDGTPDSTTATTDGDAPTSATTTATETTDREASTGRHGGRPDVDPPTFVGPHAGADPPADAGPRADADAPIDAGPRADADPLADPGPRADPDSGPPADLSPPTDPARWRLADLPAPVQLVAAALLLAQTARDGGGDVTSVAAEITRLSRDR